MIAALPPVSTLFFLILQAVMLATVLFLLVQTVRRSRAEQAGRPVPTGRAQSRPLRVATTIFVVALVLSLIVARSVRRSPDPPQPPTSPGLLVLIGLGPPLLILTLVSWVIVRRWRALGGPDLRLAHQGKHDEALARVRARIDRRLAQQAGSAGGRGKDRNNAYAAPATLRSPAEAMALARDWNTLGTIEALRSHWEVALAHFRAAEAAAPALDPTIVGNKAQALVELGHLGEGLPLLRQAIAQLPESQRWGRAQLATRLAGALLNSGETAEVTRLLDQAEADSRSGVVFPRSAKQELADRIQSHRTQLAALRAASSAPGGGSAS